MLQLATKSPRKRITKKKKKGDQERSFELCIKKCWKDMDCDIILSDDGLKIMNSFGFHMFDKIIKQCFILVRYNFQKTCMARDVQSAIGLCIDGELSKWCMSQGTMAVNAHFASLKKNNNNTNNNTNNIKTKKTNMLFPVGKIAKYMKQSCMTLRISAGSPVYLSAILQYLTKEVLNVSEKIAIKNNKNEITSREIFLGIQNDPELKRLVGRTWIRQSGTVPDTICYINNNNNNISSSITDNNDDNNKNIK